MQMNQLTFKEIVTIAMRRNKLPQWVVASRLSLSPTALHNRLSGLVALEPELREKMCKVLGLTQEESATNDGGAN